MGKSRLLGVTLLVGGMVVLGIAYQQSVSLGDEAKHIFTGDYRDKTTWMVVIGAIASVLGLVGLLRPAARPRDRAKAATPEPERVRGASWKLRTRFRRRTWFRLALPTKGKQP